MQVQTELIHGLSPVHSLIHHAQLMAMPFPFQHQQQRDDKQDSNTTSDNNDVFLSNVSNDCNAIHGKRKAPSEKPSGLKIRLSFGSRGRVTSSTMSGKDGKQFSEESYEQLSLTDDESASAICDTDDDSQPHSPKRVKLDAPNQEAQPSKVTSSTGPQYIVEDGLTWEQAMEIRRKKQRHFLNIGRGRRASRGKALRHGRMSSGASSSGDSCGEEDDDGAVETQCPHCSKSYRQNNSFYKHLYEHHPYWDYVSKKFNASKHQQVMLMQSAELLLSLKKPHVWGLQPLVRF